jgi:uncharacterized protein (UPF0276 family)
MRFLEGPSTVDAGALIGLAYGPWVHDVLARAPDLVDYVEIPFELLHRDPSAGAIQEALPAILHCASMSMAGFVPPDEDMLAAIEREASRMRTPWIGEHLAFLTADPIADPGAPPTALTYTVCPQLSEETVDQVVANFAAMRARFGERPILLENSPQYFVPPGSTLSMVDFVGRVLSRCDAGLLLDLSHFYLTSINMGFDAAAELCRLPLERVVEIHLSGLSVQSGVAWDDHARLAPEELFQLLAMVLERGRPRALTFEYNWTPNLPFEALRRQVDRARTLLGRPGA